jgi:hypothetical protein
MIKNKHVEHDMVDLSLIENDFKPPFLQKEKEKNILIIQIYVDDIIFGATIKSLHKDFVKCMQDEF